VQHLPSKISLQGVVESFHFMATMQHHPSAVRLMCPSASCFQADSDSLQTHMH
jgi:hypothetical protein